MSIQIQPDWIKPSTILFATELPANEKVFAFALASARQFSAKLIIFHAYDTLAVTASETSGVRYYDYAAAARIEEKQLRPLAQRAVEDGVKCDVVVRPGLAAAQILAYVEEHSVHGIIMGTRCPGPLGKLFIGSVAEAVVRSARVPVMTVGPQAIDPTAQDFTVRNILCAISLNQASHAAAEFAARLSAQLGAHLILQHVAPSREEAGLQPGAPLARIEAELRAMIPADVQQKITVEPIVTVGDPAEELLYQSKLRQCNLLVFGAQEASLLSTLARQGVVNKVLARALCPVVTLAAAPEAKVFAGHDDDVNNEIYLTGVF